MLAACESDADTATTPLPPARRVAVDGGRGIEREPAGCARAAGPVRGKGGGDAWVPAPPALVRHARRMPPRRYWFPSPVSPGHPVTPYTIWRRTTDLSMRAGAGHVPPHRLRHTYATELVRAGQPLTSVTDDAPQPAGDDGRVYRGVR